MTQRRSRNMINLDYMFLWWTLVLLDRSTTVGSDIIPIDGGVNDYNQSSTLER